MALEAQEFARALRNDEVQSALQQAVKGISDPWRNVRHFLAGLVTFCAAVIVGIFNALPDAMSGQSDPVIKMLGGVLAWLAIAALVATACGICAQLGSWKCRKAYDSQEPYDVKSGYLILTMGADQGV